MGKRKEKDKKKQRTTLAAPFRVVDPATGKTLLEVRANVDGAGRCLLFNATGQPVIELAALEDLGTGFLNVNDENGERRVNLEGFDKGGQIDIACPGRGSQDGPGLVLRAVNCEAAVFLAQGENFPSFVIGKE